MKHRIQFYVEDEEYRIMEAFAEHQSRSISNFIMHCALAEVRKRAKKQPDIRVYRERDRFPGYIYFVQSNGFVKIGLTAFLENRLKEIRRNSPSGLSLIKYYKTDNMAKEECKWQHIFQSKRITGEWFELDGNDIEYITSKTPQYNEDEEKIHKRIVFLLGLDYNVGEIKKE